MPNDRKAYHKEYYLNNKEYFKEYREKNKETRNEYSRQYRKTIIRDAEYKAKANAKYMAWYHENFEKIKDKKYAKDKAWRDKNKDIINSFTAKRRVIKLQRMPKWLTKENKLQIKAMYTLATSLNKSTGVQWHVDHIIPLQGKNVSGLHVPENLQVVLGSLNNRKSNKYIDE
jgi:5-methylcytosine-specific restriction endonuclease McrA